MLAARAGGHRRGSPRYSYNAVSAGLVDGAGYPARSWGRVGFGLFTVTTVKKVCVFITAVPITKLFAWGGTREEPGTLTQGGTLFSLVPLVWESNPKLQGGWCKPNHQPIGGSDPNQQGMEGRGKRCVGLSVCLLLQYLLFEFVCLLLQDLVQSCLRGV
jgi:hypothetical protein